MISRRRPNFRKKDILQSRFSGTETLARIALAQDVDDRLACHEFARNHSEAAPFEVKIF